jgi:hypothetical protein
VFPKYLGEEQHFQNVPNFFVQKRQNLSNRKSTAHQHFFFWFSFNPSDVKRKNGILFLGSTF